MRTDPILEWYRKHPDLIKPGKLRLAIDFDYTLTAAKADYNLSSLPSPQAGSPETLRSLYSQGWYIIVATARFDSTVFNTDEIKVSHGIVSEFLLLNNIPYDLIWKDQSAGKPHACWYLDDRSLPPFPGWEFANKYLSSYMCEIESIWQAGHPYPFREAVKQFRIQTGGLNMQPDENVFGEIIYAYTRKQALEDGVLVDLTGYKVTREYFKFPVACSSAVWAAIDRAITDQNNCSDIEGILHDIFFMGIMTGKSVTESEKVFAVLIQQDGKQESFDMRLACGPGDEGEPVLTIMFIDED